MRGSTTAIKWASDSVTNRQKSLANWKRVPKLHVKKIVVALPICVMCQIIPRTLVKSETFPIYADR